MVEELLLPIREDKPCGENPRLDNTFSNPYYQLKHLRQQARLAEKQRSQQGEAEIIIPTEWREIEAVAIDILKNQAKDLEVSSWLMEAWTRIHNFEGVINGLNLLGNLVETFGNDFSQFSEEDIELQLSTVQGLSGTEQPGTLIMPLMNLLITQAVSEKNYATWQYQQAVDIAQLKDPDVRNKRIQQGGVELSRLQQAAKLTSDEFKDRLKINLVNVLQAVDSCNEKFKAVFSDQAPNWNFLRQTIGNIQNTITTLYPENIISNEILAENIENKKPTTGFQERESVLSAISEAADYFLKHEPHSPIIYLLQQAVRWADLSLPELMQEIFSDNDSYYTYCKMTGIPIERD